MDKLVYQQYFDPRGDGRVICHCISRSFLRYPEVFLADREVMVRNLFWAVSWFDTLLGVLRIHGSERIQPIQMWGETTPVKWDGDDPKSKTDALIKRVFDVRGEYTREKTQKPVAKT